MLSSNKINRRIVRRHQLRPANLKMMTPIKAVIADVEMRRSGQEPAEGSRAEMHKQQPEQKCQDRPGQVRQIR